MKKITIFSFLFIVVSLLFSGCVFNKQITASGIAFESSAFEYYVGDEIDLKDIIIMKNVDSNDISIFYSSSNISVAIINNNCVLCLEVGNAQISAEYILNNKQYKISSLLTVLPIPTSTIYAQNLNFEIGDITLKLSGDTYTLIPIITPQNCTFDIIYSTTNFGIIEIYDGVINPLSTGNTLIIASIYCSETDFITYQINVKVEEDISITIIQNSQNANEIATTLYSGYTAVTNNFTLYTLCLYSNLDLSNKEICIEFYDSETDLLDIFEVSNSYFEENGQKLYLEYYIKAYTGSYIIRGTIFESVDNYEGTKNFELQNIFNVAEYITDISIIPSYTVNGQIITLVADEMGAYTLYNSALNNEEEKVMALVAGKPYYVNLQINLSTGNISDIAITFDNENILIYENGLIYVLATGAVNIIITALDGSGVQSTFLFNVFDTCVESFEISADKYTLYTNGISTLELKSVDITPLNILPSYSVNQVVTYEITENIGSSNVLSVTANGIVTALSAGTAQITITIGTVSKTISFTIQTLYEIIIETSVNSICLNVGFSTNISYEITKDDAIYGNQNITYSTLINGIVTSDNYLTIEKNINYISVYANCYCSQIITLRITCADDSEIYIDIPVTINPIQ